MEKEIANFHVYHECLGSRLYYIPFSLCSKNLECDRLGGRRFKFDRSGNDNDWVPLASYYSYFCFRLIIQPNNFQCCLYALTDLQINILISSCVTELGKERIQSSAYWNVLFFPRLGHLTSLCHSMESLFLDCKVDKFYQLSVRSVVKLLIFSD